VCDIFCYWAVWGVHSSPRQLVGAVDLHPVASAPKQAGALAKNWERVAPGGPAMIANFHLLAVIGWAECPGHAQFNFWWRLW
jgi:hypothetical protein